jgi:hypothetical protein
MIEIFLNKIINRCKIIRTFFNKDLWISMIIGIAFIIEYSVRILCYPNDKSNSKIPYYVRADISYNILFILLILFFLLLYSSMKTNFNKYKTTKKRTIYITFIGIYIIFLLFIFMMCLLYIPVKYGNEMSV